MPSWISLTDQQRVDMVAFIKTFSPRWQTEKSGDPINVPAEPALTWQLSTKELSKTGMLEMPTEGRGDGPSAPPHSKQQHQPIRPYNFAAGSRFLCGVTNSDLYKTSLLAWMARCHPLATVNPKKHGTSITARCK
jgi:hypothetical protein